MLDWAKTALNRTTGSAEKAKGPPKGGPNDLRAEIGAEYGNSECFVRSQPLLLRNKRAHPELRLPRARCRRPALTREQQWDD